jgi:type 1 fimbria pilin
LRKIKVVVATLAMTLLLAAPAFAQTTMGFGGFNDLNVVTFGGNCVVNDFVEICDVNTGQGGL